MILVVPRTTLARRWYSTSAIARALALFGSPPPAAVRGASPDQPLQARRLRGFGQARRPSTSSASRTSVRGRGRASTNFGGTRWLAAVLLGTMPCNAYYGVPTNIDALDSFKREVVRGWYRSLRRRSQRSRLDWTRMNRLVARWLPSARIVHPWPYQRRTSASKSEPKARAQCGSPARWDLCGGRPESSRTKGPPYRDRQRGQPGPRGPSTRELVPVSPASGVLNSSMRTRFRDCSRLSSPRTNR